MDNPQPTSPRVLFSFPDYFPDEAIAIMVADFDLPEEMVGVKKRENHVYAAMEWTIPTVVSVYLGKVLVDALMKEWAKEYSPKIVAGVKALALRCKEMAVHRLTSTGSENKLSKNYHHSAAYSLVVELKGGQRVKMLFDEGLTPAQWEEAIDGMLATVATNYTTYPEDALTTSLIAQATHPASILYVAYNREREGWELHNGETMMALQRGQAPPAADAPSGPAQ